ncbi:hypothetical protein PVW46_07920 [Mameliella sp. AT18]|uniref:hypothetical protein n=1 Tax=Mameliella sp. AT18 TaxID=3028385 RepID=UPI00237B2D19|nr:hypothetical protein [Mameliella sp. AT18]MDD9729832.1 hypothetical protein [Mameliella sp. AT18]
MSYSANEIATLAQKAARGAGFPPHQAQVFGAATVEFLASGGEAQALLDALSDPDDSPILRLPLLVEDIQRAVDLAGPEITLTLQPGDEALAPAYARLTALHITRAELGQSEDGLPRLCLDTAPVQGAAPTLPPRIAADPALIDRLSTLAALTYVPATDSSRSAGAGAGDIDND